MYEKIMNQWKLELSEEKKKALLDDPAGDALLIQDIYLTNVAIAVYISWKKYNSNTVEGVKDSVSRILRLLDDYAEKYGFFLPVIGFVRVETDVQNANDGNNGDEEVKRWAGDQDWNRGDFSLILLDEDRSEDIKKIYYFISSASAIWTEKDRVEQLLIDDYIARLQEKKQSTQLSIQHNDLLNTIELTWSAKKDEKEIKETLESWVDRQIEHAQSLITRG